MKLKKIYFSILLLLSSLVYSQGNFTIDYDYSRMCLDDKSGYIEIYYSFRPMDMKTAVIENDTCVTGVLSIQIGRKRVRDLFVDRTWEFSSIVGSKNNAEAGNNLVGMFRFVLQEGNYYCDIMAKDGNDSSKQFIESFNFEIKTLNSDHFTLSDLQLATSIEKVAENKESPFYKNHYDVVPNPGLMFGDRLPVVYLYCEFYGLNIEAKSETLKLDYVLVDSDDSELNRKTKFIPSSIPSMVFVKPVNIRNYGSGRHRFILTVTDTVRNISEQVSKSFYIYNPHIIDTTNAGVNAIVVASEYFSMSEAEIDELFAVSRYLASDIEKNEWNRLINYHDKQVYLFHFWRARDVTPDTPINEYKEEYMRRAAVANEMYYSLNRKGFATDRGRIYCLYGKPSNIERFPGEFELKPHEIWEYNHIEGGVVFVFADLFGFSDLILMHSTKIGELRDDNWRTKITAF